MSTKSNALLQTCFLLLCLLAGSWALQMTEFEVPKTVAAGRDAVLNCYVDLDDNDDSKSLVVKWFFIPSTSVHKEKVLIYQRLAGRPAVTFHRRFKGKIDIQDVDSIVLKKVKPSSSGIYECVASTFTAEVQNQKMLAVFNIGTGPILTIKEIKNKKHRKKKLLKIGCRVKNVSPKPYLKVTVNGRVVDTATIVEGHNRKGMYQATANIILGAEHIDEGEYEVRCEMTFADPSIASFEKLVSIKKFLVT